MSKIQNPVLQRLESQTGEKWERAVNDVTTGTPLTITLPDTYSAAKHLIPICISFDTDKK